MSELRKCIPWDEQTAEERAEHVPVFEDEVGADGEYEDAESYFEYVRDHMEDGK